MIRAEVLRPQAARAGHRRNLRIAQPDRRQRAGIVGPVVTQRDGARGHAARHQHRLDFPERRRGRARVRRIDRDIGDDRAGAFAHPGLRQSHDVGALRRRRGRRGHDRRTPRSSGWLRSPRSDDAGGNRRARWRSRLPWSAVCRRRARPKGRAGRQAARKVLTRWSGVLVVIVLSSSPLGEQLCVSINDEAEIALDSRRPDRRGRRGRRSG